MPSRNSDDLTIEQVRALNRKLAALDKWNAGFVFRRAYPGTGMLEPEEALFLQMLMGVEDNAPGHNTPESYTAFFLCTPDYLEEKEAWNRHDQIVYLNRLEPKGYVTTKIEGTPPQRWLRINYDTVERDLQQYKRTPRPRQHEEEE